MILWGLSFPEVFHDFYSCTCYIFSAQFIIVSAFINFKVLHNAARWGFKSIYMVLAVKLVLILIGSVGRKAKLLSAEFELRKMKTNELPQSDRVAKCIFILHTLINWNLRKSYCGNCSSHQLCFGQTQYVVKFLSVFR